MSKGTNTSAKLSDSEYKVRLKVRSRLKWPCRKQPRLETAALETATSETAARNGCAGNGHEKATLIELTKKAFRHSIPNSFKLPRVN